MGNDETRGRKESRVQIRISFPEAKAGAAISAWLRMGGNRPLRARGCWAATAWDNRYRLVM